MFAFFLMKHFLDCSKSLIVLEGFNRVGSDAFTWFLVFLSVWELRGAYSAFCLCLFSFWLTALDIKMTLYQTISELDMLRNNDFWIDWCPFSYQPTVFFQHRPSRFMDVSLRSFSLCCDLLSRVCQTAVTHCKDALENHLHVIVGTLIPLVHDQVEVQEQVIFQINLSVFELYS